MFLVKAISVLFVIILQINIIVGSIQQQAHILVPPTAKAYPINISNRIFDFNKPQGVRVVTDYTVLIYMIASDLEAKDYAATKNILQMENPGSNSKVNILIETGGGSNQAKIGERFIDFTKVQIHKILPNDIKPLFDLGQKNMGDPNTLSDFIVWGISNFPAKKYAVILWDHGSGLNGFGNDLMFNNDKLTPIELRQAFLTAKHDTNTALELIGFDACAMSSLEIASRLQNATHYMVSSEEVEPSWGWNYTSIIQNLSANPEQSGSSLGAVIGNSYFKQSKYFSTIDQYGADKQVTLAVIDITKIPQLVKDVNALSNILVSNIHDLPSAISLSKSIDLTEHYGQSAHASSGFVDLYDLLVNIQAKYPSLSVKINAVQNLLKAATLYKIKGDARPNANGLSVYMPLSKNEFSNSTELFVVGLDWLKMLYSQKYMIASDNQPPIIKSIREGDIIKANVYGSDVANIFAQIVTNSSKDHKLMYIQSVEPSSIDNEGYFQYKEPKFLVVCNEFKCIPASVTLELNRDEKFAFIPVNLESSKRNIHTEDMSLVYEIGTNGKFTFLGATSEIDPQKTIPKEMFSLVSGDKIFFKGLAARAQLKSTSDISGQKLSASSFFQDLNASLVVNDPNKIEPRYLDSSVPFGISFVMCDYSDNCDKTRWYTFSNNQTQPMLPHDLEFGYDVVSKNTSSFSSSQNESNTYVNPIFGFKLQYPSDWIEQRQNVYDNHSSSDDTFADPMLVSLSPINAISSAGNLPTALSISVNDWPFKDTPKYIFDFFNKTYNQKKALANNVEIINSSATMIAGNPAFRFTFKYISIPEQSLRIAKEQRLEQITTILMNNRMYTIDFASYSSQFYRYLPKVVTIINSFSPYAIRNSNTTNSDTYNNSDSFIQNRDIISKPSNNSTDSKSKERSDLTSSLIDNNNAQYLTYNDPIYRYKIKYPFYPGVGEPISLRNANPVLRGQVFTLNADAATSTDKSNSVNLIISSFQKNETRQIQNPPTILDSSGLHTFDISGIVSNINSKLSLLKSFFINFAVLNKSETTFKNHPAYLVEYSYFNPAYKTQMQEKVICSIIDDQLFIFEYAAKPSNYYTYMPILNRMINSFEFEGQGLSQVR